MPLNPFIIYALRDVYDPVSGINIVDLGLVYGIEEDGGNVRIQLTMIDPKSPLIGYITGMTEAVIRHHVPDVDSIQVDVIYEPAWTLEMAVPQVRDHLPPPQLLSA